MPIPSNYPPGVSGNEPQIAGHDEPACDYGVWNPLGEHCDELATCVALHGRLGDLPLCNKHRAWAERQELTIEELP